LCLRVFGFAAALFPAVLSFALMFAPLAQAQDEPRAAAAPATAAPATSAVPTPGLPGDAPPAAGQDGGAPAPAVTPPHSQLVGALALPRDLSLWGMFVAADAVVKAVMAGLIAASVITWTIWFAKTIELRTARQRLRAGIEAFAQARSLAEGIERLAEEDGPARDLVAAAVTELQLSPDNASAAGVKDRIASHLELIEANCLRAIGRGVGVLATIGATAPFVGLFGTVWGIMNSFIGISKAQTTNLAVVAPGIAEALLATAFGLAAAIPAVIIYNLFSRSIAGYRALLREASSALLRLLSRELDRHGGASSFGRLRQAARQAAE
jgi:biopolymer transport protein ExbB